MPLLAFFFNKKKVSAFSVTTIILAPATNQRDCMNQRLVLGALRCPIWEKKFQRLRGSKLRAVRKGFLEVVSFGGRGEFVRVEKRQKSL